MDQLRADVALDLLDPETGQRSGSGRGSACCQHEAMTEATSFTPELTEIASGLGKRVVKNVVALGALQEATKLFPTETFLTALRQDPAQSSSIVLTTVTDVVGFFSFLVAFGYRGGTDDVDLSGTGQPRTSNISAVA